MRSHAIEIAHPVAGLLENLAARGGLRLLVLDEARGRFEDIRGAFRIQRRRPQEPHEKENATLLIVGKHRDRAPVILDLAHGYAPCSQPYPRREQARPTAEERSRFDDRRLHRQRFARTGWPF